MSSQFRKILKNFPQFFTILGAICVSFSMLLSIINLHVLAEDNNIRSSNETLQKMELMNVTDSSGNNLESIIIPSETPTVTSTTTTTSTATNTPTSTATNTPTSTPTSTATSTPTSTATSTPTSTATNTPTSTATNTPTSTATNTPATPTPDDPTPTPDDPTPTPDDPTATPTPDDPTASPTPPTQKTPDPTQPPTLPPPMTTLTPSVLIPVTGMEMGNNSPLDKVQSVMFNMGLGFLGLGLVLQSLRKKLNF